ncbi:MAG: SRPBCC family protein [Thiohalocapsa sp.]
MYGVKLRGGLATTDSDQRRSTIKVRQSRTNNKRSLAPALPLCGLLVLSTVGAGDLLDLRVAHDKGRYLLSAHILIDAPAAAVHRRLTDYANLTELNPSITQSEILAAPQFYDARVSTVIEACVLGQCRTLRRVEDVHESPTRLVAVIVPEQSNFTAGHTEWLLQPRGRQVHVKYRAELEPGFSIPPLLGTAVLKHGMERELLKMLENLERLTESP